MNNDRFKFRVRYKSGNYYAPEECLKLTQDGYLCLYHNGIKYPLGEDDPTAEHIVEQCTGLKDKNGNLIYEGDIVRIGTHTFNCTVVYQDSCFWLDYETPLYQIMHMRIEIIGNIHDKEE